MIQLEFSFFKVAYQLRNFVQISIPIIGKTEWNLVHAILEEERKSGGAKTPDIVLGPNVIL